LSVAIEAGGEEMKYAIPLFIAAVAVVVTCSVQPGGAADGEQLPDIVIELPLK
jgi:hypothetical protein